MSLLQTQFHLLPSTSSNQKLNYISKKIFLQNSESIYNTTGYSVLVINFKFKNMNPGHQPQRFLVFTEVQNGRAFTIKDSDHIFQFDRYGGWYDEFGNYYNENGEAGEAPSSSQSYSHSDRNEKSFDSQQDQFQKQFGKPGYVSDDQNDNLERDQEFIASNIISLEQYPKNTKIRIYFTNLGFHSKKLQVLNAYKQKAKGLLSVVFDKNGNKYAGTGYFIASDVQNSLELIHLQGKKIIERPLHFTVQKYEQNILNPVLEKQLEVKEDIKKFVPKTAQQEQKPVIQIPWKWYKFQKEIFPKKSGFKEWMIEHGFVYEVDFKSVQKIDNDPEKRYAKIEMKVSTFNSINGLQFEGKTVQFLPLQI